MDRTVIINLVVVLILIFCAPALAGDKGISDAPDKNSAHTEDDLIILEDTSGLSKDAVREKAEKLDVEEGRVDVKDVIKSLEKSHPDGTVNLSEIQAIWENLSPKAEKYDWVQSKSGEWFKGEIKSLYRDDLEFDSDEIGIYVFDFDDIKQIKSYQVLSVNVDNAAIVEGILRYKDGELKVIQGDQEYSFSRDNIVALAPADGSEFDRWSGKVSLGIDIRKGNTSQLDFTARANIKRLTSRSRLIFDYLGRYSEVDNVGTVSDNRLNEKYDVFLNRNFFWTPLFGEFYQDKFANIQRQVTLGVGIGYTIFDRKNLSWYVSGGPAFINTRFYSVEVGSSPHSNSAAIEMSTSFEYDITKDITFNYDYKITLVNTNAGGFKHHMVTTLENELTDWLDLDITYVWDFLSDTETSSTGDKPSKNDHQIIVGFGVDF